MMEFQIEYFDEEDNLLTFHVEVTHYHVQKPMGKWADSDVDCYGYTDLEWEVNMVTFQDVDGNATEKAVDIDLYSDYIDEKLLEKLDEMKRDSEEYYD